MPNTGRVKYETAKHKDLLCSTTHDQDENINQPSKNISDEMLSEMLFIEKFNSNKTLEITSMHLHVFKYPVLMHHHFNPADEQ